MHHLSVNQLVCNLGRFLEQHLSKNQCLHENHGQVYGGGRGDGVV